MYKRPIVKDDFEVPEELVTKNFILRPLTINYLDRDKTPVSRPNRGEERRSIDMRRMSRCFTWFPIVWFRRTQYIPSIGLFYKNWGFHLEGV